MAYFETANLPEILIQAFKEKKVFANDGSKIDLAGNVTLNEAALLYNTIRKLDISKSVEIGFAQGVSSLAILKALEDNGKGNHIIIDPYQDHYNYAGKTMVEKAGLAHRMNFYQDYPENIIPQICELDFAFIDASHLFHLTMLDFVFCNKKLNVGGVIAFHDMDMPAIYKIVNYILKNHDYQLINKIDNHDIYKGKIKSDLSINPKEFVRTLYYEIKKPLRFWGKGNLVFLRKLSKKGEEYRQFKVF